MQKIASDIEIKRKGFSVLFRELGGAGAIRFLSQITHEKRDYMRLQERLFEGMTVEGIYKKRENILRRRLPGLKFALMQPHNINSAERVTPG